MRIDDSVAKVDDEVAGGEDLDFQRRWWKFERRAPAKAERTTADRTLNQVRPNTKEQRALNDDSNFR